MKYILLLFVASTWIACNKQTVYHSFQSLPTEGWQRKDTILFDVQVPDSFTSYGLSVEIRNRNNYPYQNLHLSICCNTPDSISLPADTLQLTLSNKEGKWEGMGWGSLFLSQFQAGRVPISKSGIYHFKLSYTLADSILYGINDIGIKLER